MKTLLKTAMLTGACMIAAPALAQTTPADHAAPQQTDPPMQADPPMTPQAADPAQAPQTADVRDDQGAPLARAAVEVQEIGTHTAVADDATPEPIAAAVQDSGAQKSGGRGKR